MHEAPTSRLEALDLRLLRAMRTRLHGPAAERIAKALGKAGENGAVWLAIGVALALVDSERRTEWLIAAALGPGGVVVNYAVKLVVRRPRPVLEGLAPLGKAPSSLSFPSAHSTSSFAVATYATKVTPEAAVLFALAVPIALGRPYLGMHYPSDVLVGATLGVALGLLVPLP